MSPEVLSTYHIIVEGELDPDWSNWLNGAMVSTKQRKDGSRITVLSEICLDQAALRGLLNRLWDFNLEIIAVMRTGDDLERATTDGGSKDVR